MYAVYSVLIVAFFVVVSPYLLYQAIRYRKYIGSLSQRMGYLPVSFNMDGDQSICCLLYTSPSPRDGLLSRMPSSA